MRIFDDDDDDDDDNDDDDEIPYNSENKPRGLYFTKALFEGLIFGGAYIRRG